MKDQHNLPYQGQHRNGNNGVTDTGARMSCNILFAKKAVYAYFQMMMRFLNIYCFLLSHSLGSASWLAGFPDSHHDSFFDFLDFLGYQLYLAVLSQLSSSISS